MVKDRLRSWVIIMSVKVLAKYKGVFVCVCGGWGVYGQTQTLRS